MKEKLRTGLLVLVSITAMTACGGSGDDGAGQLSTYQVSPDEVSLSTGTSACPGPDAKVGDILVIGGTAPYTAYSPDQQAITFGPAGSTAPTTAGSFQISNRNTRFAIFATGCLSRAVNVMDAQGRLATVTVKAASGAGT